MFSPQPSAGPALTLPFPATFVRARREPIWRRGLYELSFEYHSMRSARELAAATRKDFQNQNLHSNPNEFYGCSRHRNGVFQSLTLWRRPLPRRGAAGFERERFTPVTVREAVDFPNSPARWFRGGMSDKPPVSLIRVPFLPGVWCNEVEVTSLDGLISSKGVIYRGTDASVFQRILHIPLAEIDAALAKWALANGYAKTRRGSYFRQGAGIFEACAVPTPGASSCVIKHYTSKRVAAQPVAWMKD